MKKNKLYSLLILLFFALLFNTCQKYPEGGLVYYRIKHLFGKNEDNASKSWKLKLYEVNGIDSTLLIKGNNLFINDNGDYIIFHIAHYRSHDYYADTKVYNFLLDVEKNEKLIHFGSYLNNNITNNDTSQCFLKNNVLLCQRNIFNPEKNKGADWNIRKLTDTELMITMQLNNSYKIILSS